MARTLLVILRWAYKQCSEIARRMRMYHDEYKLRHPKFSECSLAECGLADKPVGINAPNILYGFDILAFGKSRVLSDMSS